MDLLSALWGGGSGLTPHGFCLTWDPGLLWLHAGSDLVIFLAYFSIPLSLLRLVRWHTDPRQRALGLLFVAFILACGATHLMAVLTLYAPAYWAEGVLKALTAGLSIVTAFAMWPLVPVLQSLPSRTQVEALNRELEARVAAQDQAAAKFLENQTRLLLAQEAGQIGTWDCDIFGGSVSWSGTQAQLYGLAAEDAPQRRADWLLLLDADCRHRVAEAWTRATRGGIDHAAEFRVTLPDGSVRWLAERGRVVANFSEGSARMVGVTTDVTERMRLTERLTESNAILSARADEDQHARELVAEQMRVMFENSPDALFVVRVERPDPAEDAGATFVFETYNPSAERLTGRTAAEIVGLRPEDYFPPEAAADLVTHYRRCLTSDGIVQQSVRRMVRGREREFETALAPVRDPRTGLVSRIIGASRDVTERAAMETQLRHVARAEATNRLVAGIAHDFNNILQALMGGLEMLLLEFEEPGSREYAEVALHAARRGAALTHRLLAFSRQQSLQPRPVDAGGLVGGVVALLVRTTDPATELVALTQAGTVVALADAGQLEAAVINLVCNAADAMPAGGGRIEVEALTAEPAPGMELPPATYAVVRVRDTGTGMTEAVLRQACEPFFTTKGLGGSGLGLSMVQGFARQSGGDIRIDSAPGRGTTVEIFLPLEFAAGTGPGERGPPRVMLVDDAADVLVTAGAFLRHAGFVVDRVASGREALARLEAGEPCDALVTDYAMPGINGIELLTQARRLRPGLPALIITGFDQTAMRAREVGARVLQKPFERLVLVDEVQALLGTPDQSRRAVTASARPSPAHAGS